MCQESVEHADTATVAMSSHSRHKVLRATVSRKTSEQNSSIEQQRQQGFHFARGTLLDAEDQLQSEMPRVTCMPGLGAEAFRQKLAGLQASSTGLVPVTQLEALLREVAATLTRHQVIAILRNLPRTSAQQVSVESLVGALGM